MLAISMKSQHTRLHNSDPRVPDNSASLSAPNPPSTTVAHTVKPPESSITSHTMLAVATPLSPSAPVLHCNNNGASKRPKLSLQTSCLPVSFGNSTTALSLNFSASCSPSPTVRNTFKNAYDAYRRTSSPAPTNRNESSVKEQKTSKHEIHSTSQNSHNNKEVPYQLPLGIRGILRNSPHVGSFRRASISAPAINGSGNGRRALFPAKKRVNYRFPLEEEIKTVHFTARHSDLASFDSPQSYISSSSEADSESDISDSSGASDEDASTRKSSNKEITSTTTTATRSPGKRKKYTRSTRQIRAVALRDRHPRAHEQDLETPQTPIERRSKRQREWRWTLGPINDDHVQETGAEFDAAQGEQEPQQQEPQSPLGGRSDNCIRVKLVIPGPTKLQSSPEVNPILLKHEHRAP